MTTTIPTTARIRALNSAIEFFDAVTGYEFDQITDIDKLIDYAEQRFGTYHFVTEELRRAQLNQQQSII